MTPPNTRRTVVYIAGPYTQGHRGRNVLLACELADALHDAGFSYINPHLSHYADVVCPRDYEDWMDLDFGLLAVCDALIRIPGPSDGANREVEYAESLGLPVFHNVIELFAGLNNTRPMTPPAEVAS